MSFTQGRYYFGAEPCFFTTQQLTLRLSRAATRAAKGADLFKEARRPPRAMLIYQGINLGHERFVSHLTRYCT